MFLIISIMIVLIVINFVVVVIIIVNIILVSLLCRIYSTLPGFAGQYTKEPPEVDHFALSR